MQNFAIITFVMTFSSGGRNPIIDFIQGSFLEISQDLLVGWTLIKIWSQMEAEYTLPFSFFFLIKDRGDAVQTKLRFSPKFTQRVQGANLNKWLMQKPRCT